jgi:hypothetical protein
MTTVIEQIPESLAPAANAALAWINDQQGASYKLTGLVDPDLSWQPDEGSPTDMALVLCDNDMCAREQVRIQLQGDRYHITAIETADPLIPPHLDPPAGVRNHWLQDQLMDKEFTLVLFYRGFW